MKNKYNEILDLFKGHNDEREWMNEPFISENLAVATDGVCMVYMPKNLPDTNFCFRCPASISERIQNNMVRHEDNSILTINVPELKRKIDMLPKVQEDFECIECDGTGKVEWEYAYYTKEDDCPVCDGSGYNKTPTGSKIPDPMSVIKIGKDTFYLSKLTSMIKSAELLDSDTIEMIYQGDVINGTTFKIKDVRFLIMSMVRRDQEISFEIP